MDKGKIENESKEGRGRVLSVVIPFANRISNRRLIQQGRRNDSENVISQG